MNVVNINEDGALKLIKNIQHLDERGLFAELYRANTFAHIGIIDTFVQDNYAQSYKNVLRGLHYQLPPYAQSKLIFLLAGHIFDAAIDLRADSFYYGKVYSVYLQPGEAIYVPAGFAHGYAALEDAIIYYKCGNYYNPEAEAGIYYNDPALAINWPLSRPIVSAKDKAWPLLKKQ
ncbi:MAG: dTDP-4-dehydrorhamnose 3,5-epimerase [Spirochaetaceae bacterium]|nr:dTDP-4-dehydrorhamnose 3,5-epimerase [Spirochaetaceae bacterium]